MTYEEQIAQLSDQELLNRTLANCAKQLLEDMRHFNKGTLADDRVIATLAKAADQIRSLIRS